MRSVCRGAAWKECRFAQSLGTILTRASCTAIHVLQPEAFYEFVENGQRTVFAVFEMADPSQIPVITEPLFNLSRPAPRCPRMAISSAPY
jgi:hypothetical protein